MCSYSEGLVTDSKTNHVDENIKGYNLAEIIF